MLPQVTIPIIFRAQGSIVSRDSNITDTSTDGSLMYIRNNVGTSIMPSGTLAIKGYSCKDFSSRTTQSYHYTDDTLKFVKYQKSFLRKTS